MNNVLHNFDRVSFWLGFLAASLFWWLLGRLRPQLRRLAGHLAEQAKTSRRERSQGDEIRVGNDALRRAQSWHLASPLFSLDEILIPPRLLAPAPPPYAYEPPPSEDITDWAILYTPDAPEFASYYHAPTLDIAQALAGGSNLALTGQPGSGKSVALAYLACQMARKAPGTEAIQDFAPLLLHVGDLELPAPDGVDAETTLLKAFCNLAGSIPGKRQPGAFKTLLTQGRLMLLLDGLDELTPGLLKEATDFLGSLLAKYPTLRVATTAHPGNLGKLPALGFHCVALASWDRAQRSLFISRWSDLWDEFIASEVPKKIAQSDSLLIVGWLLNNSAQMTPLELTLKTWAAFAGDALGPGAMEAIEAYLRRMTASQNKKNRPGLEQLAAQMTLAMEPITDRKKAERWLGGSNTIAIEATFEEAEDETAPEDDKAGPRRVRARGALPDLMEAGLVVERSGERVSLVHPGLAAYLAGQRLAPQHAAAQLIDQPEWAGRMTALKYMAVLDGRSAWAEGMARDESEDPLQRGLLEVGGWLRGAPEGQSWVSGIMRRLALCLQKDQLPLGLRARALYALVISNHSGVAILLRQLLGNEHAGTRQLAALGLGYLRDGKSVEPLIHLIGDISPGVSRAAILALVAIGDKSGLEAVAYALLHGDEGLRKAAAQAFSNHPEEGHPTLQEGSTLEDAGVRRAITYGLGRIGEPWGIAILEKLAAEDTQWVVQDAANQVLATLRGLHPRAPRPLPPLVQTPWLIAFAGEHGMGVAPGKPAYEMLRKALRDGNEDQRAAALYFLGQSGDEDSVMPIYRLYYSSTGEIRELAFNALWNLAACGIPMAQPAAAGL